MTTKKEVINALYCDVNTDGLSISGVDFNTIGDNIYDSAEWQVEDKNTCWSWWQNYYYPQIIRETYPVYIKEKAEDKGKQAYELIKKMRDKGFVEIHKVKDFVELMDFLIKEL